MTPKEWQDLLSDPDNWPDDSAENWPAEWKLFYWATKEMYTNSVEVLGETEERGLNELFREVLILLGYEVSETSSRMEIKNQNLSYQEHIHSIRRIARFLLEQENIGKSAQSISSELTDLGYRV